METEEMGMRKFSGMWLAVAVLAAGFLAVGSWAVPQASPAAPSAPAAQREPGLYMTFQTDKGAIACKLYEKQAPVAVRTMVGLAIGKMSYVDPRTKTVKRNKFFDGLTFHRVIPEFMIQGGDPLGTGFGDPGGPGFPYRNETSPGLLFDVPGRLALANTGSDNTNGSQFFITEVAYPSLNGGYTVWGQCDNLDVVKAIARVRADGNNKPLTPVHIQHVIVERVGPAPANAPEAMPAAAPKPASQPAAKTQQ
jgi:peptidyl-prolyl cis-trans isomerase A (cyclophilin A)